MNVPNSTNANEAARQAWESNAEVWDRRMGMEGNDFVNLLIWPLLVRLMALSGGELVLDVACGNGLYSLRMVELGARVVGFDFSTELIARAQAYAAGYADRITYHVVDATDYEALLALGVGRFDLAVSQMALMDIADIEPLARALPQLLRPGGAFIFAIMHPCFNGLHTTLVMETADESAGITTKSFLKLSGYLTPFTGFGRALRDQTRLQPYFHRPLQDLLLPFFRAGFVMDALEEAAFPPEHQANRLASWGGGFSEFPPVLMVRLRSAQGDSDDERR
jgi:2-polyprenyl-3-methyl-5-hydroxy-6-metoxy-1,4-benzoquinol methylase